MSADASRLAPHALHARLGQEVQLSLAAIKRGTHKHTFIVALDATSPSDMAALRKATHSVIASFCLPKAVTPG